MHVEVAAVPPSELGAATRAESTAQVRDRVARARRVASLRLKSLGLDRHNRLNAALDGRDLEAAVPLEGGARRLLSDAAEKLKLSARSYVRVLRVARTLADLVERKTVGREEIAEALSYRGSPVAG